TSTEKTAVRGERQSDQQQKDDASKADEESMADDERPDSSGLPAADQQVRRKSGTVRVINADNSIETRTIELGVTTRVQMQVLDGLKEGDRVITGIKQTQAGDRPSGVAMPRGMGMRGR